MNIITINPQVDPRWQQLVCQQRSDVFHSPAWINVLADTYDFDMKAAVILNGEDKPRSGLAYCIINDMMDPRIASLPFSDFCDPLAIDHEDWNRLIDGLLDNDLRLSLRCLHNQLPLADKRLTLAYRAKWHCVDLQRDEDELWMGLHGSARRAINKAQRNGVTVRTARHKDDLRAFFELHLRVRKYKYQLLAQPYRFFERIWDHFLVTGNGALMLADYEGEVIGGVMYLEWQDKLFYKFNASNPDPKYISLRPNDLIVWEGMKYGQARGYQYLDFGVSDWDQEGLLQYKRKFATEEKTVSFLRYLPEGLPTTKEKQVRQLLPRLTDLFVDTAVPDQITEKAGDALYQFFT